MRTGSTGVGVLVAALALALPPIRGDVAASCTYVYENSHVDCHSPWPAFRRDRRNTGRTEIPGIYVANDAPWHFRTGKGLFSTPVLGADGTVYLGSADRIFYAIRDGHKVWSFRTGEVIDSAATIHAGGNVTVPSGDGHLYHLKSDPVPTCEDDGHVSGCLARDDRILWTHEADPPPSEGQLVSWFEGNVILGLDGTVYAGNTGGPLYAIDPAKVTNKVAARKWRYDTGNSIWSAVGIADDPLGQNPNGLLLFGSLDVFVHAITDEGDAPSQRWQRPTTSFISSSAAIGAIGDEQTAYIASFDSNLYALDPLTGLDRWRFPTAEHVYGSAALDVDANGDTSGIYFGSADGILYKLAPGGSLVWTYDTGEPIRSSPALGRTPDGSGRIVYFGSGNGKVYALNDLGSTATRRWSYDTTPDSAFDTPPHDADLVDRNDVNPSPTLGPTGVHVSGEHGFVWYIPYDYCLQPNVNADRCSTEGGDEFDALGNNLEDVFYVTAGGSTKTDSGGTATPISAATTIATRLVVRQGGDTQNAAWAAHPQALPEVTVSPAFDFDLQPSGDRRYLFIAPQEFLEPDTEYTIDLKGAYTADGVAVGTLGVGGTDAGTVKDTLRFRTAAAVHDTLPLDEGEAIEWRRLAAPLPPLLPSVNQIGFDSYDWLMGVVDKVPDADDATRGRFLLWVQGGKRENGTLVADPESDFSFPLTGQYRNEFFILRQNDLTLTFSFGAVPLERFELRGRLPDTHVVDPGAAAYAETFCPEVPFYGPFLLAFGLCNADAKLVASGTYLTGAYSGPADDAPADLQSVSVAYTLPSLLADGKVVATLTWNANDSYSPDDHTGAILLSDPLAVEAVTLDYRPNTVITDLNGNIGTIELTIPAGTELPASLRATVITDVVAVHEETLTPP